MELASGGLCGQSTAAMLKTSPNPPWHPATASHGRRTTTLTLNLNTITRRGTIVHLHRDSIVADIVRLWHKGSKFSSGISEENHISLNKLRLALCVPNARPRWPPPSGPATGVRLQCRAARKDRGKGSLQSQAAKGRDEAHTTKKESQGSRSSDAGMQGGGVFAMLASLKDQLDGAAVATPNTNEEKVAKTVTREAPKRNFSTGSSKSAPKLSISTRNSTTTGQQPTGRNPSNGSGPSEFTDLSQKWASDALNYTASKRKITKPPRVSPPLTKEVLQADDPQVKANFSVSTSAKERDVQAEELKPRPNISTQPKSSNKSSKPPLDPLSPGTDKKGASVATAMEQTKVRKMPQGRERGPRTDAAASIIKNSQEGWKSPAEDTSGSDSDDQGVSKGAAILAAMQRAAAAERAKPGRKRKDGGDNAQIKGGDRGSSEEAEESPPQPIVVKPEWVDQIRSLEKLLYELKQASS